LIPRYKFAGVVVCTIATAKVPLGFAAYSSAASLKKEDEVVVTRQGETLHKQKKEVLSFYRKNLLASKD